MAGKKPAGGKKSTTTKKRSAVKKSPARKKKGGDSIGESLKKIFTGITILLFLVVAAALIANHFLGREVQGPIRKKVPHIVKKIPGKKRTEGGKVVVAVKKAPEPAAAKPEAGEVTPFEVYPREEVPDKPIEKPSVSKGDKLPLVALIIDDMGHDRSIARKLANLDAMMTFSILPYGAHRKSIAKLAEKKGLEVMLHLPMEPMEYPKVDPGPGALLSSMTPDQLIASLDKGLAAVPYIKGVNNHMGSRLTTSSSQLYQIFTILKKEKLFFIDSRTSAKTLCRPSARLLKIPFAQRDIFLDHLQTRDFVEKQLTKLVKRAERNGAAIGIGHPYNVTYEVLRDRISKLRKRVKLVAASDLVRILD